MKKSETYIWISLFLAAAFFFITWLLLQWNFAVSALLSAGIYVAMTMLIKPVRKIGNVNLEIMPEGEALGRKLEEAREDFESIRVSMDSIEDPELKKESERLHRTAGTILAYLEENPQKIPQARRFIDYYQDTASALLKKYVKLQEKGLRTREAMALTLQTRQAMETLNRAFEKQLEKLMQNELFDMEADIRLLKQTMKMEGYEEEN